MKPSDRARRPASILLGSARCAEHRRRQPLQVAVRAYHVVVDALSLNDPPSVGQRSEDALVQAFVTLAPVKLSANASCIGLPARCSATRSDDPPPREERRYWSIRCRCPRRSSPACRTRPRWHAARGSTRSAADRVRHGTRCCFVLTLSSRNLRRLASRSLRNSRD